MSKRNFDSLKEIISRLKKQEIHVFENYVTAFAHKPSGKNILLALFRFLTDHRNAGYEETAKHFGYGNTKSLDKNISRLKSKVLDSLSLEINTSRKGAYSKISNIEFKVNRLTLAAEILLARGSESEALKLFDEGIAISKKYELFDELSRLTYFKILIESIINTNAYTEKNNEEIQIIERKRKAMYRSRQLYYKYFSIEDFKGIPNGRTGALQEILSEIHEYIREIDSDQIRFFSFLLQIEYFQASGNYRKAEKVIKQLIKLIRNSPPVCTKKKYANALDSMADNYVYLMQFDKVIEYADKALSNFKEVSYDYLIALENKFLGYFYNKNYKQAGKIINLLLEHEHLKTTPFKEHRAIFLKSSLFFIQKKHKASYQLLWNTKKIQSDTEGWNTWIRIMTILNYIELAMLDEADFKIENFRKFIQRNKDKAEFRKRDLLIMKVLNELEKTGFDFQKVLNEHPGWFEKLESGEEDYTWLIKSPEMIVFHQWFKAKAANTEYDPDYYQSIKPITTIPDTDLTDVDKVLSFE